MRNFRLFFPVLTSLAVVLCLVLALPIRAQQADAAKSPVAAPTAEPQAAAEPKR